MRRIKEVLSPLFFSSAPLPVNAAMGYIGVQMKCKLFVLFLNDQEETKYEKKYYLMIAMVLSVFVWCAGSFAADKTDKIGFINLRQIMQDSNAGKKAADEFKKFFEKKTEEIKSAENELKTLKNELDKQSEIMTQDARSEKESAYQKKMRDYQLLVNDTNEELKRRDQEMSQKMMPEIMKFVRSMAGKEKYTLVLDVATMPVPYYDKRNDFTDKVIVDYNKSAI